MQGTFHWIRINVFGYATENEELIYEAISKLAGTDEIECDVADSEHGNRLIILSCELTKQREIVPIFVNLGRDLINELLNDLEKRIDDDCVFYLRLNKQDLVQDRCVIAHHGDVLSITGKIVSHPARKEIATENMRNFLNSLVFPED